MAVNKKIVEMTNMGATVPAAVDDLVLVDVSDTTDDPTGTSKRWEWLDFLRELFATRFGADAGANDTYVVTLVPVPAAYVTGEHYRFKANTANTGACTVNFNSLGAKTIKKAAGGITTDLDNNDIRAGQWVDLVYDGTNMQMQSLLGNVPSGVTPSAHAVSHQNGGTDEIDVTGLSGVLADPQTPITENVQDIIGAMLVGGEYDDGGGTLRVGYLEIPQNSQSTDYTAVLGDQAKHLFHPVGDNNPRTFTIPANASVAYRVGTAITFVNKINTLTIAITSDVLTWAEDGSTGSRSLAANGIATALKITSTEWLISGTGIS